MAIASTLLSSALKSSFWNPENLCGVDISFNLMVNWWVRLTLFLRIPQGFWTSSLHSYLCLPSLTVASSIPSLGSNVSMPGIQMQLRLSRPGWCGVACSKGSKWGRVSLEDCGSLRSACAVSCLHIPPLLCLWRVPGVISPVLGCVFMSLERLLWHPGNIASQRWATWNCPFCGYRWLLAITHAAAQYVSYLVSCTHLTIRMWAPSV